MKKTDKKELNWETGAKTLGWGLHEFRSQVMAYRVPGWKEGKFQKETLLKYFSPRESTERDSSIIAISNQKGGEGKTTLALCLAEVFSRTKKTLLVDWDPQANASQFFFQEEMPTVFQSLGYRGQPKEPLSKILRPIQPNLDLLPAGRELANVTTPFERDDFELLRDVLLPIRSQYEMILIDCPPSLGLLLENALIAADFIVVPVQTRAFSLQGIQDLHETIQKIQRKANPRLKLLGAVLNQFEKQKALSGLAEGIQKYFPVFATVIQRKESIPQSQARMSLLSKIDEDMASVFVQLGREIEAKILEGNPRGEAMFV